MSSTSRSLRSSISPFRSRKPPAPPPPTAAKGGGARPSTPSSASSSSSSKRPSKPPISPASPATPAFDRPDASKTKENVTVTVRFRPLSSVREINKGDEIAWYADGDYTVRNEFNSNIAYGFDRVFGPATTTRHVYDVAAQQVVNGAMQGINGTVFAYGVTSSGKTHTMHGEQKSPGIIPLAVKDVFGIIQETPGREFLLRVSYLEIYNEVINDLLDPTGQNLRIREDVQGTYVEGIKEEVVLSPAHALSLIASGEEHRHVGSNNFNLLSSRSHTIFTLTIESSPRGENQGEDVTLSQLNLIDLAGSESSKTETTGLRRKEGSYINKSLLTLGTVISKLTDEKATHVPYRDSKLTRLLQSSLSGHGRVSLICTVTPASSNSEETHNTLKFAHRSKHVEIKASQNKIMDDKSLIKKYQKEISCLKQELQQLKRGMIENPYTMASNQEDLVNLKLQLEAGQVKLQSRLEEEEQAKAALMGRIQRLTKLILVSTKNTMQSNIPEKAGHIRRHSFGEDELAYLPDRKREYMIDDDAGSHVSEISADGRSDVANLDDLVKDYRRNRRRGMLGWFKLKKPENLVGLSPGSESGSSASGSPASRPKPSQNRVMFTDNKDVRRKSISRRGDEPSAVDSLPERTQAGDLFSATVGGRHLLPTGTTIIDQMDLLREQVKMLAGEVALCTSSLKRLSEQAVSNPEDSQLQEQMQKLKDEIKEKKLQIRVLEHRMVGSVEMTRHASNSIEMSQAAEIETLSQEKMKITEEKDKLEIHCEKLTEEASYAKELAADAAVELRNLAEEVTKLTYQNAKLTADLAAAKEACCISNSFQRSASFDVKKNSGNDAQPDACSRKPDNVLVGELQHELNTRYQKETSLVTALSESDEIADELRKRLNEAKCREEDLENELANMWVLVAEMRKSGMNYEDISSQGDHVVGNRFSSSNGVSKKPYEQDNKCGNMDEKSTFEELKANYHRERRRCKELESLVLRLKGDDISGLDITSLEELQNLHVEAITKICHVKFSNHAF
ncbi:hypothetical protein HYC85_007899 [Camellia sinensis]|uniref:Kinesin motor domain-containing protein n=1 Tax=Camellia sinensis TaxID=4442 RepID=A0A7J7HQB4_CAMSI|nr:hypothetical protein HYC85_007899 [Camellia sinensis]